MGWWVPIAYTRLGGAKLTEADLRGSRLKGATFVGAQMQKVRLDDADWTKQMYDGFLMTFLEDVDILEAQQASMLRDPERPLIDLNVDAPGIAARNMLAERIAAESAGETTAAQ